MEWTQEQLELVRHWMINPYALARYNFLDEHLAVALHRIIYKPAQNIVILSATLATSIEVMANLSRNLQTLPDWFGCKITRCSKTKLELDSGTRIMALPLTEWALRGMTINCAVLESSFFYAKDEGKSERAQMLWEQLNTVCQPTAELIKIVLYDD